MEIRAHGRYDVIRQAASQYIKRGQILGTEIYFEIGYEIAYETALQVLYLTNGLVKLVKNRNSTALIEGVQ